MAAPVLSVGPTLNFTVPASLGNWYAYDITSITDAGNYLLFWGGYCYDTGESGDPFRMPIVVVRKSDFTIVAQTQLLKNSDYGYVTIADVWSDGTYFYTVGWHWASGVGTTTTVTKYDIATFTLQHMSNSVTVSASTNGIWETGGNERAGITYLSNGHLLAVTSIDGWVMDYNIGTNTLSMGSGAHYNLSVSGGAADSS